MKQNALAHLSKPKRWKDRNQQPREENKNYWRRSI